MIAILVIIIITLQINPQLRINRLKKKKDSFFLIFYVMLATLAHINPKYTNKLLWRYIELSVLYNNSNFSNHNNNIPKQPTLLWRYIEWIYIIW